MAKIIREGSVPANDPMFSEGPLIASSPRSNPKSTTAPAVSSDGAPPSNPMQEVEDGMEAWLLETLAKFSRPAQAGNTPSPEPPKERE